ncbi:MAG: pantoate--beta-alanine ligase, partial [Pseudonocardia sp.]|nr:pantoate--beta-alanine ligase [Pseudonocardia sp.]
MTRTAGGYAAGELTVHASPAAIAAVTRALRAAGRRIALVPTMGALHEGHRELIRHARRLPGATVTVVSIFV